MHLLPPCPPTPKIPCPSPPHTFLQPGRDGDVEVAQLAVEVGQQCGAAMERGQPQRGQRQRQRHVQQHRLEWRRRHVRQLRAAAGDGQLHCHLDALVLRGRGAAATVGSWARARTQPTRRVKLRFPNMIRGTNSAWRASPPRWRARGEWAPRRPCRAASAAASTPLRLQAQPSAGAAAWRESERSNERGCNRTLKTRVYTARGVTKMSGELEQREHADCSAGVTRDGRQRGVPRPRRHRQHREMRHRASSWIYVADFMGGHGVETFSRVFILAVIHRRHPAPCQMPTDSTTRLTGLRSKPQAGRHPSWLYSPIVAVDIIRRCCCMMQAICRRWVIRTAASAPRAGMLDDAVSSVESTPVPLYHDDGHAMKDRYGLWASEKLPPWCQQYLDLLGAPCVSGGPPPRAHESGACPQLCMARCSIHDGQLLRPSRRPRL